MTLRSLFSGLALVVALCPALSFGQIAFTIDDFNDPSNSSVARPAPPGNAGPLVVPSSAVASQFGGSRTRASTTPTGPQSTTLGVSQATGDLTYTTDATTRRGTVDYTATTPLNFYTGGQLGFDLTGTATSGSPTTVSIEVFDSATGGSLVAQHTFNTTGVWQARLADFFSNPADPNDVFYHITSVRLTFSNNLGGSLTVDDFVAVPEASPLWMLIGAVAVVGGGRYGWKRFRTKRALAA